MPQVMCKAILATLESVLAERWTAETARAWKDLWETAMAVMGAASSSSLPSLPSILTRPLPALVPAPPAHTKSFADPHPTPLAKEGQARDAVPRSLCQCHRFVVVERREARDARRCDPWAMRGWGGDAAGDRSRADARLDD